MNNLTVSWTFLGASMSIVLGVGQLLIPQRDSRNYTAASLLFCLGCIHLVTYSQNVGYFRVQPILGIIQIPLFTLLGPLFYFYFMRILDSRYTLSARHAVHFVPCLLSFPILLPYLLKSQQERELVQLEYTMQHIPLWQQFPNNFVVLIFVSTLIYVLYPLRTLTPLVRQRLLLRDHPTVMALGFILCFSISIVMVIIYQFNDSSALKTAVTVLFTCWIIAIYLVSQRFPLFLSTVTQNIAQAKYRKSQLGGLDIEPVLTRLEALEREERVCLDEGITLARLAEKLDIKPHQLSEILNQHLQTSFKDYVKRNRINAAKRILLENPSQTILTISMEVGFKAISTFNAAFKKETGLSPVEFRKRELQSGARKRSDA